MALVSDLVDHFKLETQLLSDHTLHIVPISRPAHGRRKVRQEKRWTKQRAIGHGTFGEVWLEMEHDGDKRAIKAIKKALTSHYSIDYMKELLALAKLSKVFVSRVQRAV